MMTRKGVQTRRRASAVLGVLVLLTVLQHGSMISSAQISESFEGGFGDWVGDFNYDPAYFNVAISSLYAFDGSYSVELFCHGLPTPPYPQLSVWIERIVQAPASTSLDIGVNFQLYSESTGSPLEVLAYAGTTDPEDYPDFTVIGMSGQTVGWYEYSYLNTFTSGPTGEIYVAMGFYNHITGPITHWIDMVDITGVTIDYTPPLINNTLPTNQSTVGENVPVISAEYWDESGVDTSSVRMEVDSVDVTADATITATGISYTPLIPLTEGTHDVYLEVMDDSSNQNKASATWWFVVDTLPPAIMNPQPANESSTTETTPAISAFYFDVSGIDTGSVILKVDSIDVTSSATVTSGDVSYVPLVPLLDGVHDVYLQVSDNSNPKNTAVETWWFIVDTQPPIISNLQPDHLSIINSNQPTIGADYADTSGIDLGSVVLEVDSMNVTSMSIKTSGDIQFTPAIPLNDGDHEVYISVADTNSLVSTATWSFAIDTTAPTTSLNILFPQYTDPISTNTYVTSLTPLNLTSSDDSGVGVESIEYLYYAFGESEPLYSPYTGNFAISSSKSDGLIYVKFKARDTLGNEELAKTEHIYLDNSPPVSDMSVGAPHHNASGTTYLTSQTPIYFAADDGLGSGESSTQYQIKKDGIIEVDWTHYTGGAIYLTGEDGLWDVIVKSKDNVNNEESERTFQVYLDNTAPTTQMVTGEPNHTAPSITYVSSMTPISFTVEDGAGSGAGTTWYQIKKDGVVIEDWTAFSVPLQLSGDDGEREVLFKSTDELGTEEIEVTEILYLDNTAPTSVIPGYDSTETNYINTALATISITADDGEGSGVSSICYGIDDTACTSTYSGPLVAGTMTEGEHRIYFGSIDRVGNVGTIGYITVFLDTQSPNADAGDDVEISVGHIVVFDSSGSDDGIDGSGIDPNNCSWTFPYLNEEFEIPDCSGQFRFGEVGEYEVTLTIKDMAGNTGTDTMTVRVTASAQEVGAFPWWILAILVAAVFLILLLFLALKRRKREETPAGAEAPDTCENCGHELGMNDTICPECDSPIAIAARK